jgi:hypothetical protein
MESRFESQQGQEIFLFSEKSGPAMGLPSLQLNQ